MKQLNPTQIKLLTALSGGNCYSGNTLGSALGVSRTAVWKQIKQLVELGVPITSRAQQGYQLDSPIQLLNPDALRQQLRLHEFPVPFHLHCFASIDSTNRFLKDLPPSDALEICCSETQTQGKGRFGRAWHSPFGENIYCSTRRHLDCDVSQMTGLSLVVSLAILETLKQFGIQEKILLKWPNDLIWQERKLCGTLIEMKAESHGKTEIILGIGLNVNSKTNQHSLPDQPWCSLYDITHLQLDRTLLLARLILQLDCFLNEFIRTGFSAFKQRWQENDFLKDQQITVNRYGDALSGHVQGVDDSGQLILTTQDGNVHYLSSGETTLKRGEA